jgi:hypothetical protein
LALFQHYAQAGQERRDRSADLHAISQLKRRIAGIREQLDDLSGLSAEEQEEIRRRKAANDERKQRLGAIDYWSAVRQAAERACFCTPCWSPCCCATTPNGSVCA